MLKLVCQRQVGFSRQSEGWKGPYEKGEGIPWELLADNTARSHGKVFCFVFQNSN